jgi:hypothetical protein
MGDKRAVEILENTNKLPVSLKEKIENILCADKHTLSNNIDNLKKLFSEMVELTDGTYKAFYKLKNT